MQKKRSKVVCPPLPSIGHMDDLAYASDDEVIGWRGHLYDDMRAVIRCEIDTAPWEIELAYVQRELDIRALRMTVHQQWLSSQSSDDVAVLDTSSMN